MNDFTFSQSSSPTSGLQGYDLDRKVKNLAPGTEALRLAARLARKRGRRFMLKDLGKMSATLSSMTDTLAKSVKEIIAGGEDVDALLEKTFKEYTEAADAMVAGELSKSAPEEPLYKGLGTVGRVASLAARFADSLKTIADGVDYPGQSEDKADPASETVVGFLEHALSATELALHAAVNEHVSLPDDDDDDDENDFVVVKSADGAEEVRFKTNGLPEELAKLAIDPILISEAMVGDAVQILVAHGADEAVLGKAIGIDGLEKAFPPKKDAKDGQGDGSDAQANAGQADDAGQDDQGSQDDPNAQDDQGGQAPQGSLQEQGMLLGRILAAAMIQADGLMRTIEAQGGDTTGDVAGAADPGAAMPPVQKSADASDDPKLAVIEKELADVRGELQKKTGELEKRTSEFEQVLQKVLKTPEHAKAMIALAKADDSKGGDAAGSAPDVSNEAIAEAMNKLSETDQRMALIKISQGGDPRVVLRLS